MPSRLPFWSTIAVLKSMPLGPEQSDKPKQIYTRMPSSYLPSSLSNGLVVPISPSLCFQLVREVPLGFPLRFLPPLVSRVAHGLHGPFHIFVVERTGNQPPSRPRGGLGPRHRRPQVCEHGDADENGPGV